MELFESVKVSKNKTLNFPILSSPELQIPGRKPVGLVEIDWQNSITNDLKFCVPFINGWHELVNNQQADTSTLDANNFMSSHLGEKAFRFGGDHNEYIEYPNDPGFAFNQTKGYTILARISLDSIADFRSICCYKLTDDSEPFLMFYSNDASYSSLSWGNLTISEKGINTGDINITPGDGQFHTIIITMDGVNPVNISSWNCWIDGVPLTINTQGNFGSVGNTTKLGAWDNTLHEWPGFVSLQARWDRSLNDVEVISLFKDPYQIFRPRIR